MEPPRRLPSQNLEYPSPPGLEAGWYEEPRLSDEYTPAGTGWRFWDGERWTGHWAPTDPLTGPSYSNRPGDAEEKRRVEAGWYDDPYLPGSRRKRYWNGMNWEERVKGGQITFTPRAKSTLATGMAWGFLLQVLGVIGAFLIFLVLYLVFIRSPETTESVAPTALPTAAVDPSAPAVTAPPLAATTTPSAGESEPAVSGSGLPGSDDLCRAVAMNGTVTGSIPTYGEGAAVVDRATIALEADCSARIEAHWQVAYAEFCVLFLGFGDGTFAPQAAMSGTGDLKGRLAVYTTAVPDACPGVDLPGDLESQLGGGLIEDGAFAEGRYGSYLSSGAPVDVETSFVDGVAEIRGVVDSTSIPMTFVLKVSG